MSNKPSLDKNIIRTGRIIGSNTIILLLESLALAQRDISHTGVAIWKRAKDWVNRRLDYNGIDVTRIPSHSNFESQFLIIGNTGKYTAVKNGSSVSGIIVEENALASTHIVQGSVFAVGILGGIYRMNRSDAWENISNSLVRTNLTALCEHPFGGFIACGWDGVVVHYEKKGVEHLESGTNIILNDIICDKDGEIFACGLNGIILHGTKNSLQPLELEGNTDDFWSIAKFQGVVYVSSITALYMLIDDKTLKLVKFNGEEIPASFYHLDTFEDSLMLSVGQKDAVLFDGKDWARIL